MRPVGRGYRVPWEKWGAGMHPLGRGYRAGIVFVGENGTRVCALWGAGIARVSRSLGKMGRGYAPLGRGYRAGIAFVGKNGTRVSHPVWGFKNLKRGRCEGGPVSWARGASMSEAASFIRFSVVSKPWLRTGWRKRSLRVCGCACIFSAGLPKSLFLLQASTQQGPSSKMSMQFSLVQASCGG